MCLRGENPWIIWSVGRAHAGLVFYEALSRPFWPVKNAGEPRFIRVFSG
jgi:hypothetical protein